MLASKATCSLNSNALLQLEILQLEMRVHMHFFTENYLRLLFGPLLLTVNSNTTKYIAI